MNRRKVHIVIWTETHFEQKHSIEFEKNSREERISKHILYEMDEKI